MAIPRPGNSYMKAEKGDVPNIEMPPLGYILGDENTPTINPGQSTNQPEQRFGGLPEVPQESREIMEQEVEDEVVPEKHEPQEQESDIEEPKETISAPKKTKEDNFRIMREAREKAERERDAVLRQMVEMQMKMQAETKVVPQEEEIEEDLDFNIGEDDLVEGKIVRKVAKRIKQLEQKLNNQYKQSQDMSIEAKIKSMYPDFDTVVSVDNVNKLNEQFPEISATLRDTPDMYNKAISAYKIMKQFGIHKDKYESDRTKAIINSQKPRTVTSISPQQGDSPLSKANAFANGMTAELQEQLRKEMNEARKRM